MPKIDSKLSAISSLDGNEYFISKVPILIPSDTPVELKIKGTNLSSLYSVFILKLFFVLFTKLIKWLLKDYYHTYRTYTTWALFISFLFNPIAFNIAWAEVFILCN